MFTRPFSLAFIVRDPLPPLRADVAVLFGNELPRYQLHTELVGQGGAGYGANDSANTSANATIKPGACWPAGGMHVVGKHGHRLASVLAPCWDTLGLLRAWRRARPDAIQVRDKVASALPALVAARLLGIPFLYWMSFPIVEGDAVRAAALGRAGRRARAFAQTLRAALARQVLYRLVLPGAAHVFVQSEAMREQLATRGLPAARMTPVPMGVDGARFVRAAIAPVHDARLAGRRVLLYLGRLAQARQSDFLLEVLVRVRTRLPAALLLLVGDAPSADEMRWIRAAIAARGLGSHVLLTGWLPQAQALGYAVQAEVGLSPIPRGPLFDGSSPTKLLEYLALGIPGVANDIPDQAQVLADSGGGLCVPMQADAFADATLRLLQEPDLAARCAARGAAWVRTHRSYAVLARELAGAYQRILAPCGPVRCGPIR